MRPARRKAAPRHISPSPMSSEEEQSSSELEEFTANENEVFSEEEDLDQLDDNNDELESLSEEQLDEDDEMEEDEEEAPLPPKATLARTNKRKKQIIEESDEERFSEEDDDEILRNKPMTKRQRAKAYQEIPEEYLELPMDTGKKKQLTEEEEQLKKSEVARRRKNQSIQRAEKDKADTINRLLKKQASKSKRVIEDNAEDKETAHEKLKRLEDPNRLRYINTAQGSQLNIPTVFTLDKVFGTPIPQTQQPTLSSVKQCQVEGCLKARKYTAKKSGKFVCSLEHYKMVEVD